jgi:tetratricopeptide (TPR) repeat protein
MKMKPVRAGVFDQRGRATTRRRQRREGPPAPQAREALDQWLSEAGLDALDIRSLDLRQLLHDTEGFDLSGAARLCQVALFLEPAARCLEGGAGWEALKRIYEHALRCDPSDVEALIKMSTAATSLGDALSSIDQQRRAFTAGESAARRAVAAAPDEPRALLALGHALYSQGKTSEALVAYEDASTKRYTDLVWSQLYRAHCLHDLGRWPEALDAYGRVDRAQLVGSAAWRVDVMAEQKALCLYKVGRAAEAQAMLLEILRRYLREPEVAFRAMSYSMWELARSLGLEMLSRAQEVDAAVCAHMDRG